MTEHAPRPGGGGSRRAAVLVLVIVLAIGAGLALGLGGGLGGPASSAFPGASGGLPGFTDLPLVTVPPASHGAATPTPAATGQGSGGPQASETPTAEAGIPAERIRIARLDIDLAIIEGDGIDAPIGKAAHYPGSAWPDGGSNIYIYGHAREGMFITLWNARVGDRIELDLVDGTTRTYVVAKILPKVPWDAVEHLAPTPTEQLTVQTSTSYYPTAPRFIAIAFPAP